MRLPHLVQHQIFAAACARFPLNELLEWLPPAVHPAVVEAAISTPGRTLKLGLPEDARPLTKALAALPVSPSPIQSLQAICRSRHKCETSAEPIARALIHHTGLSSLSLCMATAHNCISDIFAAVGALTSLQSLQLGDSASTSLPTATMPALHSTLHSLPQLQHLCVSLEFDLQRQDHKRKHDDLDSAAPCHCLAATLSAASGLTSLTLGLHSGKRRVQGELAFGGSSAPIVLPHLGHLNARVQDSGCAAALLRRLNAPLTSLRFGAYGLSPADHGDCGQFAQCLASFTRLHTLHVAGGRKSWACSVLGAAFACAPAIPAALQGLQVLRLTGSLPWVLGTVAQLATVTPRLQRLTLRMSWTTARRKSQRAETPDAVWVQLVDHLRLLQLQRLDVSYEGSLVGPAVSTLSPLTCLSALRFQSLTAPMDILALPQLTTLKFLHLHECTLLSGSNSGLVSSLLALRSLTNLALSGVGMPEALVATCTKQQLHGAWPALCWLGVHIAMPRPEAELQALVRAVCDLPALKRLVLLHNNGSGRHGIAEGNKPKLEGLLGIASEAGVTVSAGPHTCWEAISSLDDAFTRRHDHLELYPHV